MWNITMYLSAAYFIWIRHNTTAYHLGRYSLHLLLLKSSMVGLNLNTFIGFISLVYASLFQQVVAYGCQNGSVRIFYPSSGSIKTLGLHNNKITDIKIRTTIRTEEEAEIEISPIVVSASEDGSVKIWIEGGRTFDCHGHKFKVGSTFLML